MRAIAASADSRCRRIIGRGGAGPSFGAEYDHAAAREVHVEHGIHWPIQKVNIMQLPQALQCESQRADGGLLSWR